MEVRRKVRVLVVDDSSVSREILYRGISSDPYIEVIATATDPFEARDKILQYEPDVMTCDIEMPKMNGIEFIERLLPQYKLPVIMVTTVNKAVFNAMNAGAVDFVAKPDMRSPRSVESFISELIVKIKIASSAKVTKDEKDIHTNTITNKISAHTNKIIAIGASTGGTEAIYNLLKTLPQSIPGIVITQHIPPIFSGMFAERLNKLTSFSVKEAETGDYVQTGKVLIAPGNQHMKIKKIGDRYKVICFEREKINGHCPSIDVLFESVAKEAGENSIGIILTGMGYDGAKGLLAMRRKGAKTIGQDENSSVVYGMPKVAFNIGAVEQQVSLINISKVLYSILK